MAALIAAKVAATSGSSCSSTGRGSCRRRSRCQRRDCGRAVVAATIDVRVVVVVAAAAAASVAACKSGHRTFGRDSG